MTARQGSENPAWDQSDELWENERNKMRKKTFTYKIIALAERTMGESVIFVPPLAAGGYNCYTLFESEEAPSPRSPQPHLTLSSTGMIPNHGPFMIIQDLKAQRTMSDCLERPRQYDDESLVLDPNISDSKIRSVYGQMAPSLLQLAQPTFPRIGSLSVTDTGGIRCNGATDRHQHEQHDANGNAALPNNDIISSEDDRRTKYVARQLFYKLAKQGRLSTFGFAGCEDTPGATLPAPDGSNSFRLWCDDFRPNNVLVDKEDDKIVGVPEMWEDGLDDCASVYEKRLETFLSEMEKAEKDFWETGRFWVNYAARKSWAFDAIYWKYIDGRFFGKREHHIGPKEQFWKSRIDLLSEREREAMEPLVQIKLEESKEQARKRLSAVLFE
ncbi:hypothetical protein B0H66DRAFT_578502 [Apodospora peruviana]|uniref:Aminoglycoside phosphotransferase domain-containing protein n=1 Tax=Apodospora peruviana TaxID=516989 RepID=A0AAE0HTK3_9PEZI|nr:hypothetical protein B0H66DRAFT_578502 [Apodospora peruviana]